MTTTETWTIGRLLTWTTEYLKKHGSSSPRLDGEILLAHARGCQRIDLYTAFGEEPGDEVKAAFREMVRRRAEGTPVAYLVGFKEFYSLPFEVNPDVLIPRPETEHLVMQAIDRAKEFRNLHPDAPLQIADVGTGSGAIAIALAKHLPQAQLTAIDLSPRALEVAKRNVAKHAVEDRVTLLSADLLESLPAEGQFALIVSNPPYVSEAEFAELDISVREHEPREALVAGPKGIETIVRLLEQAPSRLSADGSLMFELSPMLAQGIQDYLDETWQAPEVIKDLAGQERVVSLQLAQP